jgi:hypothetical protein
MTLDYQRSKAPRRGRRGCPPARVLVWVALGVLLGFVLGAWLYPDERTRPVQGADEGGAGTAAGGETGDDNASDGPRFDFYDSLPTRGESSRPTESSDSGSGTLGDSPRGEPTDPSPAAAEADARPQSPASDNGSRDPAERPPRSAPAGEAEPPDAGDEGRYRVQIGAFRQRADAVRHRQRLAETVGYSGHIETWTRSDEQRWWRVWVGPWRERVEAEAARDRLASAGFDTLIRRSDSGASP